MSFDQTAYNRAYYLANKERIAANVRAWQTANPKKAHGYKRKHALAHPERKARYYQENREVILARVKAHSEGNSASVLIKRRVWAGGVNLGAIPPWLTDEHRKAMQWLYDEARRLTKETGVSHVVDHIEPLNGAHSCGLHVPWNLQVLTDTENKRKRFREDSHF
jgi:hypothetical protein